MDKLIYKAGTAVATASLVLGSIVPFALADTTVEISGNGSNSDNTANVGVTNTTVVEQYNSANISNDIDVDADTGKNDANDNTGGDVDIDTGDASANVTVANTANSNQAEVDGCCLGDTTVKISGNGTYSDNDANVGVTSGTHVYQVNEAYVHNDVDLDLDTGKNDANDNTGGNVSIDTGNAKGDVTISNAVNSNVAQVGGGNGGSVWIEISGNGSNSDNTANVGLEHVVVVEQYNSAHISNDVDVDADTGKNDANDNTGGDVEIDTGNAEADVDVSNLANFNAADVDACDCLVDLTVKIADNGTYSDNDANVGLVSGLFVGQGNEYSCGEYEEYENGDGGRKGNCADVDVDLDTGKNDAEDNTGDPDGDPSIDTGNAEADVTVQNTANSNVVGDVDGIDFPDFDFDGSFSGMLLLLLALFS